jgi:putative transposase
VRRLCKVLEVHPSGFYAWRLNSESKRDKEDKRLLVPIKESWLESGNVYGYRKVSDDLRGFGEQCGINRVHRLMRLAGIRSQTGYTKRKYKRGGAQSSAAPI